MIPLISLHQPSGFQLLMGRVELGVSLRHLMKESEVAQSCPTLCNPVDYSPSTRLLHSWDSPGKNTGVGCHFLLQGIFPTQGSNPGLLHCRQML